MRIDETLYQTTLQIKQELDLILDRIEKMELHSSEVSEQVYLRVKKDYLIQLGQIKSSFEIKCKEIEKALQELYTYKKEQGSELQKNKDIFEEAKFRHVLGEYSEDKFQEIKSKTDHEISNYENILADLQKHLNQYEELIQVREKLSALPPSLLAETPKVTPSPKTEPKTEPKIEPKVEVEATQQFIPPPAPVENTLPTTENYFSDHGGDYFNEDAVQAIEQAAESKKANSKTEKKKPAAAPAPSELSFDDSISAILKSIPLDDLEAPEVPEAEKIPEPAEIQEEINQNSSAASKMEDEPATGKQSISIIEEAAEIPDLPDMEEESVSIHAKLICVEGDMEPKEIVLSETISIGRSPSNDVVLKEAKVSRQHAAINKQNNEYILIDLKSSNGVYVNGKKVEEQVLQDGDQLSVGSFKMLFQRF